MKRWALLALALAACVPANDEEPARVFTSADIRELARSHGDIGGIPADGMIAFRGQPIPELSPPYATQAVLQQPDIDGLPLFAAFSEGAPAAYYTTEFWYDRSPVWAEPLYIPVTEYDPANPFAHRLAGSQSIFSVGTKSSFYSPYWRVVFVVVPEGTDPASLTHVGDVIGFELHDGPLKICPLIPDDIEIASPDGGEPVRPLNGDAVAPVRRGHGWVEGEPVTYLDFGNDRFTVSEGEVVDETPIFTFATGEGEHQTPLGLPSVGGVGPRGSQATFDPGGRTRFGGLWRMYFVNLPASASVFVPPELGAFREMLRSRGVQVPDLPPEVASDPRAPDYALRVAADGSCLTSADGGFPDGCTWLDSQARIEALLPTQAITETDITITCPLVEFGGAPVTQ